MDNDGLIAEPGKNLVLIYVEGLDVIYTEEDIFPGLTPNLNRLNSEGEQLENYIPIEGTAGQWLELFPPSAERPWA